MPSPTSALPAATEPFERFARALRLRLATRALLGALLKLSAVAAALAWAAWWWLPSQPWLPYLAWTLVAFGFGLGWRRARQQRWSDAEIATYLDARLELPEVLLTWLQTDQRQALEARAAQALSSPPAPPRAWTPPLLLVLPLLGALALPAWLGPRLAPTTADLAPERLAAHAPSLQELSKLAELPARDDVEYARRQALAQEAARLEEAIRQGMSLEQAQAELGALREALSEERNDLGGQQAGSGLDAAARELAGRGFKELAETLAQRDLGAFDRELERLASERERSDRESARRALAEAAAAARAQGAHAIADSLDQSAEALQARATRNARLRELSELLQSAAGESVASLQKQLERSGSATDAAALADALADVLEGLTEEQRRRLAENLAKLQSTLGETQLGTGGAGTPMSPEQMAEQLRQLAEQDLQIDATARDRAFDQAEQSLDRAAKELTVPRPGSGQGNGAGQAGGGNGAGQAGGAQGNGNGAGGQGGGNGGGPNGGGQGGGPGGGGQGGGAGDHGGQSNRVDSSALRARANARAAEAGGGSHRVVTGQARVGEAPLSELRGVEGPSHATINPQSDGELPAEYRDQLERYFSER